MKECTENIDEAKLPEVALFEHVNECVCSYTVCIVLGVIALIPLGSVLILLTGT